MQTGVLTYAPNISWLFPELPFKERSGVAARLGFRAIEFGFPSHADLVALQAAREELGLKIVLFNQDVPVWDRENRGYLVDPSRSDEFKHKLDEAVAIARRLEVSIIMLPVGVVLPGMSKELQDECMLGNLADAAPLAADANVVLTIEMLNPLDNPGYFLTSSREAIAIVKQVNHPHIRYQFDTYHIQMMEGNLVQTITQNIDWVGHIQFADYPGRHEPGTGLIDFAQLSAAITASGYRGYIGLEYKPLAEGSGALQWALSVV